MLTKEDLDVSFYQQQVDNFIKHSCVQGELGNQEAHIHFQGVIVMKVPNAASVHKHIAHKATTQPNAKMAFHALTCFLACTSKKMQYASGLT